MADAGGEEGDPAVRLSVATNFDPEGVLRRSDEILEDLVAGAMGTYAKRGS
jgi:hypothetical protein